MEELFKQLKASGHVPESWSFDDFNYMYSDKDRRSKMFSKMGFEPDDTSVTYNPYNNMVVDFNRGTVYQGGIKEVRNKVEEKPRTGGDLNRLNYFPKPSGKTQKELADERLKNEEAYVSYTKAVTKNGVKDYIKQSKDLETKVEKLGGGAVAAYELFDEFYKTAQGDIAKSTDILVKRLREKHNDFEDFYKNFSKFDSLSDEQKFEVANNPIMKDQDFKDIIEIREGYNVLESQKYQAKQELKQYDPQRYNDLVTIEDIQSNRDELTKTPLSKVTNTAGRLLGRTLQGVSAVIPFDKQSANIYRAGQDLIDIFPTSSKSEGQALAYQKEFTYGDKTYYAVYDTEDAVEPSSVRDESGYVVKDPAINKRALQAEGDKQKYFNPNSFATQTVDVLLDVGVDALTGKGIAKAYSTASKPSKLAYAIGTSIPGYARSYASAYNEYIKNPDIDTDDAQIAAVARGLAEGVIINRLNPLESELAESGMRRFTAEYTKKNIGKIASGEIGAREIAEAFLRGAGKMGLGGVKETGEEELEEQFSSNVVNPILNYRNGTDFKEGVTADEIANIALISLASGVLGDAGAINISKSKLVNNALKSISENQDIYNAWLRGVRESDPELASRIDEEISPIVKEASVYGNVKNKEKLIEKLIEARKLEKEIQSISVPDLKDKKKEQLAVVHSSIVDLVNAPTGDADTQVAAEEEIAPAEGIAPGVATELGTTGEEVVNPSPFKAYDFDGTLLDNTTGQLTELGLQVKERIANGEDIKVVTARDGSQTQQIVDALGISQNNIYATGNENVKGSVLDQLGIGRDEYFDEDKNKLDAIRSGVQFSNNSFYTTPAGKRIDVVITEDGPRALRKDGEFAKLPIPQKYFEEINNNRVAQEPQETQAVPQEAQALQETNQTATSQATSETDLEAKKAEVERRRQEEFKNAGEQSKKENNSNAIANYLLQNAKVGGTLTDKNGEGYEITEVNNRKDGSKEVILVPFELIDGKRDYNYSGTKLISEKNKKAASDLYEFSYTNSNGERITETYTYNAADVEAQKADIEKTKYGTISGSIPLSEALPNGIYIDLGNGLFAYADKGEKIAAIVDKNNGYVVSKSFWNDKSGWQLPNRANLNEDAKRFGVDEITYTKKYQDAVNTLNAKYDAELQALETSKATQSNVEAKKADIERRRQEELDLKGETVFWDYYGNEKSSNWNIGKKTKTRKGEDAVELIQQRYVGGMLSTVTEIVPLSVLQEQINAKYDAELATLEQQSAQQTSTTIATPNTEQQKADIERRRQEDLKVAKIQIPRYFTFNELGGAKGKSGKAMSSVEADKNAEIQDDFESKLEDGDKLIEPNGTVLYFRNGKVVKEDGSMYGMNDVPAFINGVTIDRTDKINAKYDAELESLNQTSQVQPDITTTDEQVQSEQVPGTDGGTSTPQLPTIEVSSPTAEPSGPTQPSNTGTTPEAGTVQDVLQETNVPTEVQPTGGDVQVSAQDRKAELESRKAKLTNLQAEYNNPETTEERKAQIKQEALSLRNIKYQAEGDTDNFFEDIFGEIDAQINQLDSEIKKDIKDTLEQVETSSDKRTAQFEKFFKVGDDTMSKEHAKLANRLLERVASRLGNRSGKLAREWIAERLKWIGKASAKDLQGAEGVKYSEEMLEATNRVANNMLTALDEMINERLTTIRPGISVEESQRQVEGLRKIKAELEAKRAKIKWQAQVFHGSPFTFDKFTTDKIGTGEGAQAFGWGLYFTDLESIARGYANALSKPTIYIDGKRFLYEGENKYNPIWLLGAELFRVQSKKDLLEEASIQVFRGDITQNQYEKIKDFADTFETFEKIKERNLYKATLHKGKTPDQYTWLEWDKPVSNIILDKIEKAVEGKTLKTTTAFGNLKQISQRKNVRGQDLYRAISLEFNGDKNASLFLLKNGIDGIKYPAESISRGATSDTARGFNYVVFDENAVTIEEAIKFQKDAQDAITYRAAALELARNEFAILALDSPNASSLIHEFAHIFEPDMTSEEKDLFIKHYNKVFETNETDWSTDVSEYFARTLEKYLSNGRKLTSKEIENKKVRDGIQEIFDKFTEWLKGVYEGVISYTNSKGVTREVVINDEIQAFFDKLLVDEIPKIDVPINGGRFLERHLRVSDLNKLERFQRNPSVADDDIREIALEMTADVKDEDIESYANDLELDYNNEIRKTGWQFLALGHLATRAEQLGDFELQDEIVGRMDRILSGAGRALRLGRTDLMKEFTGLRLQKLLEVKFNKAMTQQDANGFTAQDASRRVVENDAMPSPEEIMNDLQEPSESEVEEKVVVQQPSDKEKAKSFLESARKRLRSIIGQANSGVNPEMILVAVDLLKAAYYETKHSYKSIKSKFRRYAKDLGIEDVDNLYQKALESAPEIRNEIIFNDINEKIANIGKGSKIPSADPIQAVINNIYRIYTTKYKTPLEAKEKFKRDFEARQVKIADIENAISAVNYGVFSSDPIKSAEIKAKLEDLLSWHQDKVVGASAIRAKLNTVSARDAIKKILEKRLSPNDKSRFIDDIATTLVSEYGFTADEATKYAAEVRNSVERALNQKVQGSERTRAEKIFLDGIGLNKDLLEQALKETTDKINNPKTSEAERKLMRNRAKRIQTKLDNLESNIEKALTSGKQTIGKLLDAIASGMTDRVGIAAALKDQFGIKEAGLRPYLDQVNSIAQRLRAAEAINDPRAIKKAEAELGDVLMEIARNSDYKAMGYLMNFYMNQLLSGINTSAIALVSGYTAMVFQAALMEVGNFIKRIITNPRMAFAYFEAMPYVIQNTADYMRYEGWPKIVQIWKGTNLNTDITREDIQKMQLSVNYYQAKLEKNLTRKMPKRFDKAAVVALSKLVNFSLFYTQMVASKGLAIFDVFNKAMFLPYLAASERFSMLEKDPANGKKASEVLKAFKEIYVERRKTLVDDFVSQGYDLKDARVLASEIIAHEELKDLDANNADAVRDFIDMATLTGESGGIFTSLAVRANQKVAALGPLPEILIKSFTTPFLAIAGRFIDVTKYFSLAASFGPPVETTVENGVETHKVNWNQSWKTPIKFISSNLYYKTWYTKEGWQVRPLTSNERSAKMAAMTTVLAMTSLPFVMFKLGDCKFSPNSPTGCLEPVNENFRITGKGRDWDQIDGYQPYSIQVRNEQGIWETKFEFKNIPPFQALLGPIGYITDQYYQSRLGNATEKPLYSLVFGAAGAPFINMWDNSIVQMLTPMTQLLDFVTSKDQTGTTNWSKTFQKTAARGLTPYITPGGNLVNTSTNLLDDATDSQPQVAKDIKSNWFNQTVSDRLADNMIYRWALGSAPETSAIGLPVIADFDSALLPSGLEEEDIDKIDYLTSQEKRIYKTMKRFEDDGAIFRAYPRQSFNKEGEGATVEVINGLISFEEMYSGSRRIEKLFGDYLRTHIGRIERMSSKDFEGVRRMQSTFKQKVEGDLLYFKLLELGVPGLLAPEKYETKSKDEYGEPLTYINPTKIVDWLKENQIQIRGNKIITGFKYSDLLYEKPDKPLFRD